MTIEKMNKKQFQILFLFLQTFLISTGLFSQYDIESMNLPNSIYKNEWKSSDASSRMRLTNILKKHLDSLGYDLPEIKRIKQQELPFYRDSQIFEFTGLEGDTIKLYNIIKTPKGSKILLGNSDVLFKINKENGINLTDSQEVIKYLKLFVNSLSNSDGYRFEILSSNEDLKAYSLLENSLSSFEKTITEPRVISKNDDAFKISAFVQLRHAVFSTNFTVNKNGAVEMGDDEVIMVEENLLKEVYKEGSIQFENSYKANFFYFISEYARNTSEIFEEIKVNNNPSLINFSSFIAKPKITEGVGSVYFSKFSFDSDEDYKTSLLFRAKGIRSWGIIRKNNKRGKTILPCYRNYYGMKGDVKYQINEQQNDILKGKPTALVLHHTNCFNDEEIELGQDYFLWFYSNKTIDEKSFFISLNRFKSIEEESSFYANIIKSGGMEKFN